MRQMKVPLKKMQIPKGSRSHRCYGKKLVSLLRSIGLTAAPPPPPRRPHAGAPLLPARAVLLAWLPAETRVALVQPSRDLPGDQAV